MCAFMPKCHWLPFLAWCMSGSRERSRFFPGVAAAMADQWDALLPSEDYGVPAYDELVIVANRDEANAPKIKAFLKALQKGVAYLRAHPQETWQAFAAAHPELNTELNKQAWLKTLPLFASDPAALDKPRYEAYEQFLYNNKLVKKVTPLTNYAVELH